MEFHIPYVRSVDKDGAVRNIIESAYQIHYRGLAGTGRSEYSDRLALLYLERNMIEYRLAFDIVGNILKLYLAPDLLFILGLRRIRDLRLFGYGRIDLDNGCRKSLVIIDQPSEHPERHVEHPQVRIDYDHVSESHRAFYAHDSADEHKDDGKE